MTDTLQTVSGSVGSQPVPPQSGPDSGRASGVTLSPCGLGTVDALDLLLQLRVQLTEEGKYAERDLLRHACNHIERPLYSASEQIAQLTGRRESLAVNYKRIAVLAGDVIGAAERGCWPDVFTRYDALHEALGVGEVHWLGLSHGGSTVNVASLMGLLLRHLDSPDVLSHIAYVDRGMRRAKILAATWTHADYYIRLDGQPIAVDVDMSDHNGSYVQCPASCPGCQNEDDTDWMMTCDYPDRNWLECRSCGTQLVLNYGIPEEFQSAKETR